MKSPSINYHYQASVAVAFGALCLISSLAIQTDAVLVQPYNYMLDDSSMTNQHDSSGSLSPYYNDQHGGNEQSADRDVVSIIGDSLARLRFARMLDNNDDPNQHLSQEMAEMLQKEQASANQDGSNSGDQSMSSSVASMLMNVAQAAAAASTQANIEEQDASQQQQSSHGASPVSSRGSIMELDTSSSSSSANSAPSKADLKQGPTQWYNPKETIPVLKISSMATPSKYKKVYFRSEKKLVDGAFHSPGSDQTEKKTIVKPFNSGVQRRSSRGTASNAPPSILQDGVIDFLKKFRDVYVQTRPLGASAGSNLASSVVSAAASSPLAAVLAPSGGSRPNFASALSAASSMVSSAAMLSQAASSSPSSGSSNAVGAAATGAAVTSPNKSPLTAQSYVSFWSKTFPTWVRKMLKQMRRRSLYNSSKRQQHHHQQHQHASIGQKIASGAVSSVEESTSSNGSSGSSSSSSSSSR